MSKDGNLSEFFNMSSEINQTKNQNIPTGIVVFSDVMAKVYSSAERIVTKYSIPLVTSNYLDTVIQDPKLKAKYDKLMENNLYKAYYDEITNNDKYKSELNLLKETIILEIKDALNNPGNYSEGMIGDE